MISFHPPRAGSVQRLYEPRGTVTPPTLRSALVVSTVAALAPVRHTSSYGTTPPRMVRPRRDGRP
jgi:hypothetical protein